MRDGTLVKDALGASHRMFATVAREAVSKHIYVSNGGLLPFAVTAELRTQYFVIQSGVIYSSSLLSECKPSASASISAM